MFGFKLFIILKLRGGELKHFYITLWERPYQYVEFKGKLRVKFVRKVYFHNKVFAREPSFQINWFIVKENRNY